MSEIFKYIFVIWNLYKILLQEYNKNENVYVVLN